MAEEEKESKYKDPRIGLLIGVVAMLSTWGDTTRAYFERKDDVETAAKAEFNRVQVDSDIQIKVKSAFEDLHARVDELDGIIEEQDRELFELRVEVEAQDRLIQTMNGVDQDFREMLILEALEAEAAEENHVVDVKPKSTSAPEKKPEKKIEEVAEKIVKKKRKKERPKKKIEFLLPEPQYQFQQQMQQQLPPLPKRPKTMN